MMILLIFVMCILIVLSVGWVVHISQVNDFTMENGWAGYKVFKREFEKIDWKHDKRFSRSLFEKGRLHETECHANIIQFNDKGMKMHNPFSYLLAMIHIQRYIKKNFGSQKFKW